MKRRDYIAALASTAALSGCVGNGRLTPVDGESSDGYGGGGDSSNQQEQVDTTRTPDPLPPPVTDSRLRPGDGPHADTDAIEIAIHEQVNGVRREHDLSLLLFSDDARESAQNHSRDMAHKDYFAHEAPDGQRFVPNGCNPFAENLFRISRPVGDPKEIAKESVLAWMSSEGHRQNILNPELGSHGVGAAKGDYWLFVTDVFCG